MDIQSKTGGTVTFTGAITDTAGSTGSNLVSNTGATIIFRGGLVYAGNQDAFTAPVADRASATNDARGSACKTSRPKRVRVSVAGMMQLRFQSIGTVYEGHQRNAYRQLHRTGTTNIHSAARYGRRSTTRVSEFIKGGAFRGSGRSSTRRG